ncbi:DegT/DnrJ/EryC1/StrS family aminotransferase [Ileibacterium valens]|uniref:DegT/DnrJ/EryC1/StrS family aminotransferase n=1 Tax=Ileibacterium valens TaxID=1862668 RepID=UPI00259BD304|nr:aminotransferase class I/II-fold pyridoxal phosphate-dependent enzyme [Ileibacterium valens]
MEPFKNKVWLSSPTMHGDEQKWVNDAFEKNWVSTVGENINVIEKEIANFIGVEEAVALSSGTAALHMAVKLAGEKLYGRPKVGDGTLKGKKVFCSDMTFAATVNPVVYEGGEPVFIDIELDTWNMDPEALKKAFEIFPDVKLVVLAHLYGTPAKIDEIREICDEHNALLIEDAAESLGATYKGKQTGAFGDVSIISFNGNKIITGSSGGMLLAKSKDDAAKVRKWSTQSRETAPWYQHEELGYNYRMSNIIAGVVRGQLPYLKDHIRQKKDIFEYYKQELKGLPIELNPFNEEHSLPNYWLSCLKIKPEYISSMITNDYEAFYKKEMGKSCPSEILDAIANINAEGRPIWKPMHLQPIYQANEFITTGSGWANGDDVFKCGLCLPSDNKMSKEEQDVIISAIKKCFE